MVKAGVILTNTGLKIASYNNQIRQLQNSLLNTYEPHDSNKLLGSQESTCTGQQQQKKKQYQKKPQTKRTPPTKPTQVQEFFTKNWLRIFQLEPKSGSFTEISY